MMWLLSAVLASWFLLFFLIDTFLKAEPNDGVESVIDLNCSLAIIICSRNESDKIAACLKSIDEQVGLPAQTQVYLIDDHSEDDTTAKASKAAKQHTQIALTVKSLEEGSGKKAALRMAMDQIEADYFYFTDADCQLAPLTIQCMVSRAQRQKSGAVFGPVLCRVHSWFSRILVAENLNTQCVTEAFFNLGHPVMSNAANMMISKSLKLRFVESLNTQTASGDDTFFAQSLRKEEYTTCYLYEATVVTDPPLSFNELIMQRIRWASKSVGYKSMTAKLFAGFVAVICALTLFVQCYFAWIYPLFWVGLFSLVLMCIQFVFHRKWFTKYHYRHELFTATLLSLLYPTYVCGVGLLSILGVGYRWKGRSHKR